MPYAARGVRDRVGEGPERIRFSSPILAPYARRSKSLEVLIPILYLKGVSTGDFEEALVALSTDAHPGASAPGPRSDWPTGGPQNAPPGSATLRLPRPGDHSRVKGVVSPTLRHITQIGDLYGLGCDGRFKNLWMVSTGGPGRVITGWQGAP